MKPQLGLLALAPFVAAFAIGACGSDDSSGPKKTGASDRAGCNAFCEAQAKLECGMPVSDCYGLCKQTASTVPEQCKAADDTVETCQAGHLSCTDPSTLQIDDCTTETAAYVQCQSGGDGGTD